MQPSGDKRMKRPGSWSRVLTLMSLSFLLVKIATKRFPLMVAPFTFFIKFIGLHYSEDIDRAGKWISSRVKAFFGLFFYKKECNA